MSYRKTAHSVYDLKYHIVWITKYRKPILRGEIGKRVRELIRQTCASLGRQAGQLGKLLYFHSNYSQLIYTFQLLERQGLEVNQLGRILDCPGSYTESSYE
jgi:hypothetical protein